MVYWNDRNELVERLKLLLGSWAAGNTGVYYESYAIIEELHESGIIKDIKYIKLPKTAMNIDKFGHHVHKRLRLSECSDILSDALVRTDVDDFDLKSTRLKGLKSTRLKGLQTPEKEDEAVNKEYVEEIKNEIKTIHNNVKK